MDCMSMLSLVNLDEFGQATWFAELRLCGPNNILGLLSAPPAEEVPWACMMST